MIEHEKDHLAELKDIDGDPLEELADFYPMLGRSAKKRILEKCLEKTDEAEFQNGITVTGTEIYKRPVWSIVLGAAAAIAAVCAALTGGILLNRNSNPDVLHEVSSEPSEIAVVTTTEKKVTATTTAATTTSAVTTTADVAIHVETSEYVVYTTSAVFTESTTSTETTETTETTTTDVTTTSGEGESTTDGDSEITTTETTAETAIDLTGSWSASGGGNSRVFDFHADGCSGKVSAAETSISFSYSLNNDVIFFNFNSEDAESEGGTIIRMSDSSFELHWFNGNVESFSRLG